MIDLHSHILPGVDDGSSNLALSLEMARMAVADGIEVMACTPHFMPGLYDNTSNDIRRRVAELNDVLLQENIDLALVTGCDAHIRPSMVADLKADKILTLHETRYFLFEPSHMVLPRRMDDLLFEIMVAGYVPILTHPERLKWIEDNFSIVEQLAGEGVWMQITAGSLTGRFGRRPKYWAERMLASGMIHILATDAHDKNKRPPLMAEAYEVAKRELGAAEAEHLVRTRPEAVLEDRPVEQVPRLPMGRTAATARNESKGWRRMLFGG